MPTRFMYLRRHGLSIGKDKTGKPAIVEDKTPIACIAINVDEEAGRVTYSVASVNPKDNFNRDLARGISLERLNIPGKNYVLPLNGEFHRYTISGMVMQDIVDQVDEYYHTFEADRPKKPPFSGATYRAAARWLSSNPASEVRNDDSVTDTDEVVLGIPLTDESSRAEVAFEMSVGG